MNFSFHGLKIANAVLPMAGKDLEHAIKAATMSISIHSSCSSAHSLTAADIAPFCRLDVPFRLLDQDAQYPDKAPIESVISRRIPIIVQLAAIIYRLFSEKLF